MTNKQTVILASVLTALIMGLPLPALMQYGMRRAEPRLTELVESSVRTELDSFMTQHTLSQSDMRLMFARKPMPFINSWLSYAFSVGFTTWLFLLFRKGIIKLIGKQNSQQGVAGYPPQGAGSPER